MGMGAPKPGSTLPPQGGKGGVQQPVQPQVPAQGGKGNMPLPAHYQSPYANYGFDPALQSYLDHSCFCNQYSNMASLYFSLAPKFFAGEIFRP